MILHVYLPFPAAPANVEEVIDHKLGEEVCHIELAIHTIKVNFFF